MQIFRQKNSICNVIYKEYKQDNLAFYFSLQLPFFQYDNRLNSRFYYSVISFLPLLNIRKA